MTLKSCEIPTSPSYTVYYIQANWEFKSIRSTQGITLSTYTGLTSILFERLRIVEKLMSTKSLIKVETNEFILDSNIPFIEFASRLHLQKVQNVSSIAPLALAMSPVLLALEFNIYFMNRMSMCELFNE